MRKGIIVSVVASIVFEVMAGDFFITAYGAKEDGTKCTEAFAGAIAECAKAGGGRVVVPKGRWLTGAIRLKNDVELHLDEGSEILFSQDSNDYLPAVHTSWEGMECWNYCPLDWRGSAPNDTVNRYSRGCFVMVDPSVAHPVAGWLKREK